MKALGHWDLLKTDRRSFKLTIKTLLLDLIWALCPRDKLSNTIRSSPVYALSTTGQQRNSTRTAVPSSYTSYHTTYSTRSGVIFFSTR